MRFKSNLTVLAMLPFLYSCAKLLPVGAGGSGQDAVYNIRVASGDHQSGPVNKTLARSMVVVVSDSKTGEAASNIPLSWTVTSGGGHLVNQYSRSSPLGEAPAQLVLGSGVGSNTVTASLNSGASVTFTEDGIIPALATPSIIGSGPIEPDGINFSSITISLKGPLGNSIVGTVPTFAATGSGNIYGACSASDLNGYSACTLKSTVAETKILSITSPLTFVGGTVVFVTGPAAAGFSSISGSGPVIANGVSTSTVSVTLKDASNLAVVGVVPSFSATNSNLANSNGTCTPSSASGISTCTLKSTFAEMKTLAITSPVSVTGGTVLFVAGPANAGNCTLIGTGPTLDDGVASSTITVGLKDAYANPIVGQTPTFSATGTNNVYGLCSYSNSAGVSTCSLKSTAAETKTLSLTSPASFTGGSVVFSSGPVSLANSSISGSSPVIADGLASSSITIVLRDAANSGVSGITPTFSATDTGAKNNYGTCTATNPSGVSSCTLVSTVAESKALNLTSPVNKAGNTVIFNPGAASATSSTISGTSGVVADGVSTSSITVTLKDANNNFISGVTPTFSATDSGPTNVYGACSASNASGISICSFSSTKAEVKSLSLTSPVSVAGGTVTFIHGPTALTYTTITGSGPVTPDGASTSTITIVLKDAYNNAVDASLPSFTATNTGAGNSYGACTSSNSSGVSTCTLASTVAETKTLSLTAPVALNGGTVTFVAGAASSVNSSIVGTSSVIANGVARSTITITLKDSANIAIVGTVPTFTATNTGSVNTYGACSATNSAGLSTCTLASTKAEIKTLSIATPVLKSGGNVNFVAGPAASVTSSVTGTGPVPANGTSTSTITIVLYDANNNPIIGITPSFAATDTGTSNVVGTCSVSSASGSSTCTLASSGAEVKTLSLVTPVAVAGGTVTFSQAVKAANSSIVGTGPVAADGVASLSVTVSLKDYSNAAVAGITPTFSATDTGSLNTYGACTVTNASGVATCTLKSTQTETKILNLVSPVAVSGSSVIFTQAVSSAKSSITGTGPTSANSVATSTITITLHDYANGGVAGIKPTFTATNTANSNTYGACTVTNASGVSTCTLSSKKAETKTLQVTSPVTFSGGTVQFL